MENLIFSLNVVLPIFFVILLGALLARSGILEPAICEKLMKLVFYVALPASLFQNMATSDIQQALQLKFVLFETVSTIMVFFLGWGLALVCLKQKKKIAAAAHAAYRGNFAYIGMAVCQNLLKKDTIPPTIMVFAFIVPLYNILAVAVLSHYDEEGGKMGIKKEFLSILKNPMILAILAALPFSLFHIPLPQPATKTLSYMAQIATPLALLLIGANLNLSSLKADWKGIAVTTLVKTVLAPLLSTLGAVLLGFRGEELAVLFTLQAVPSAANSYIMTRQMHADAELGAGAVVATSLFSILTMTAGIWWLRSAGLV